MKRFPHTVPCPKALKYLLTPVTACLFWAQPEAAADHQPPHRFMRPAGLGVMKEQIAGLNEDVDGLVQQMKEVALQNEIFQREIDLLKQENMDLRKNIETARTESKQQLQAAWRQMVQKLQGQLAQFRVQMEKNSQNQNRQLMDQFSRQLEQVIVQTRSAMEQLASESREQAIKTHRAALMAQQQAVLTQQQLQARMRLEPAQQVASLGAQIEANPTAQQMQEVPQVQEAQVAAQDVKEQQTPMASVTGQKQAPQVAQAGQAGQVRGAIAPVAMAQKLPAARTQTAGQVAQRKQVAQTAQPQMQTQVQTQRKPVAQVPAAQTEVPVFSDDYPRTGVAYTVKQGDTLSGIATKHTSTVRDIQNANRLASPRDLQAGQTIFVPQKK